MSTLWGFVMLWLSKDNKSVLTTNSTVCDTKIRPEAKFCYVWYLFYVLYHQKVEIFVWLSYYIFVTIIWYITVFSKLQLMIINSNEIFFICHYLPMQSSWIQFHKECWIPIFKYQITAFIVDVTSSMKYSHALSNTQWSS